MSKLTAMETEYLEPGFDPSKLTKPQLRSILAAHDVMDLPPSTARKEALLDLFYEHITRKAEMIMRKRQRVKGSDKGIAFLDEKSQPSPRRASPIKPQKPKRGRSRPPANTDNANEPDSLISKPTKVRGRSKAISKQSKSPSRRNSRSKSPVRRASRSKSPVRKNNRSKSPLSKINNRSKSPSKRAASKQRKTSRAESSPSRSASRQRSDSPLSALQKSLPKFSDSSKTATAKLYERLDYIANANRLMGAKRILEHRAPSASSPKKTVGKMTSLSKMIKSFKFTSIPIIGSIFKFVYYVILICVALLFGAYLRYKYFYELPYCENQASLSRYVPKHMQLSIMQAMSDLCVPCPLYAICSNGRMTCHEGFVARPNWIAFGQECVPDLRKLSLVEDLARRAKVFLSERAGQAICGTINELDKVLSEDQLGEMLRAAYPNAEWNSNEQFESLYKLAITDIGKNPGAFAIELSHNPITGMTMLQSKTASIPLKCRLQLYMINYYKSHKLQVWSCGIVLLSLLYIFSTLRQRSKTVKKIEELVQAVLQILAEQDALNRRDPTIPSSISIHQIRDALFFKTSNRTRHRLWPLLCKAIERNSNVRESVMNIKGEQHRVWEWIGSDVLSPLIGMKKDDWARLVHEKYDKVGLKLHKRGEWTVIAGILLIEDQNARVVSLGAGLKCLPEIKGSLWKQLVRDSHAEVLARRALIAFLFNQISLLVKGDKNVSARPIFVFTKDGKYKLRDGIKFGMYISQAPCGDASMHALGDVEINKFKDKDTDNDNDNDNDEKGPSVENYKSSDKDSKAQSCTTEDFNDAKRRKVTIRGRSEIGTIGVLRTKPGRADSPLSYCHSCSDKIALWSLLGWQGALLGGLLEEKVIVSDFSIAERFDRIGIDVGILSKAMFLPKSTLCNSNDATLSEANSRIENPLPIFEKHNGECFKYSYENVAKELKGTPIPSSVAQVWYEGGEAETLADGRRLGSAKAKAGILPLKLQSAVSSERLFNVYSNLTQTPIAESPSMAKFMNKNYQKLKCELYYDEKSPFYGWCQSNAELSKLRISNEKQHNNDD